MRSARRRSSRRRYPAVRDRVRLGRKRPRPLARGLRQLRIVDQRAVRRQRDRHRVTVVLAARDDLIELPGDGIRNDDFMFRHQVAVISSASTALSSLMWISNVS